MNSAQVLLDVPPLAGFSMTFPVFFDFLQDYHIFVTLFVFGDEAADRTVVRSLPLRRKETARQLVHLPVIRDTFAAFSLSLAGLVGTGALGRILFKMALRHTWPPIPPISLSDLFEDRGSQ
jgi:hypothetical protein